MIFAEKNTRSGVGDGHKISRFARNVGHSLKTAERAGSRLAPHVATRIAFVAGAEGVVIVFLFLVFLFFRGFLAAFQLGLVLLYGVWLLAVEGQLGYIPCLFDIPVFLEVEFLGEVIYFFGL